MAEERTTPVNPKWGALPPSLKEDRPKGPCSRCGARTTGACVDPVQRLGSGGQIVAPPAPRLCAECDTTSSIKRVAVAKARQRIIDNR